MKPVKGGQGTFWAVVPLIIMCAYYVPLYCLFSFLFPTQGGFTSLLHCIGCVLKKITYSGMLQESIRSLHNNTLGLFYSLHVERCREEKL
jgi:hypothetical protein